MKSFHSKNRPTKIYFKHKTFNIFIQFSTSPYFHIIFNLNSEKKNYFPPIERNYSQIFSINIKLFISFDWIPFINIVDNPKNIYFPSMSTKTRKACDSEILMLQTDCV